MSNDTKYGRITTEHKTIPPDEPCFLLRGQDQLAELIVRFYALLLENLEVGSETRRWYESKEVEKIANAMRDWPVKKLPD